MISNDLLEEIINISNKQKYISKGLILRIALNVIENLDYSTKSRFQNFKFDDTNWDFAVAICDVTKGEITINYDELVSYEKKVNHLTHLRTNLSIIQCVLHEIEHLNEISKIQKKDFQSKLINVSSGKFRAEIAYKEASKLYKNEEKRIECANKLYREFNEKYYPIIPIEKIADIDSSKNILDSLNNYPNFKRDYLETYFFILRQYLGYLKMGYKYNQNLEKYNVPLLDYLKATNYYIKLEDVGFSLKTSSNVLNNITNNFSIEDRMKFGLPITLEDTKELSKQKIILRSAK